MGVIWCKVFTLLETNQCPSDGGWRHLLYTPCKLWKKICYPDASQNCHLARCEMNSSNPSTQRGLFGTLARRLPQARKHSPWGERHTLLCPSLFSSRACKQNWPHVLENSTWKLVLVTLDRILTKRKQMLSQVCCWLLRVHLPGDRAACCEGGCYRCRVGWSSCWEVQ